MKENINNANCIDLSLFENDELFALAQYDFSSKNYTGALYKCKIIIARGGYIVDMYALLGKVYGSLKIFDRARISLERYLLEVPEAFVEQYQLGLVCMDLGDQEGAKSNFLKALELNSEYVPALYQLGAVKLSLGELDEGTTYLKRVLDYADKSSDMYRWAELELKKNIQ